MEEAAKKAVQRENRDRGLELRAWWVREMLTTDSPFTERLTLFWHNHFATSLQKVRSPMLMARQNALLRRHALGSFRDLLHAVSKDPAMLEFIARAMPQARFLYLAFNRSIIEEAKLSSQLQRVPPRALLQIWLSPSFPVGGFAYSHGLEKAVEAPLGGGTGA